MTLSAFFTKPILYYSWFSVSTVLLIVTYFIEPYLFAYSVLGTLGMTALLFLISLFFGKRPILLAILCFIPPVIAYAIMMTINWA